MKLIWHDLALEELALIGEKVSEMFGQKVADKVVEDIINRVDSLSANPFLGTKDDRYVPFRVLHSWHNRVFYLVADKEIRIIAIWDNRRGEKKLPSLLSKRV
ncbi:MAG: type II toxin-antitoxin system RelE/ParE family toxin [Bacteroidales bacterium]|nr:type II toxin-antitoxin system RelE/ParE family toxin [Bacteroidales bacterium]